MFSIFRLPTAPGVFVNRRAELDELDRLAALRGAGRANVILVSGPPGIGKTAICLYWAHSNLDRFPDGAIYLDLSSQSLETALGSILDGLNLTRDERRPGLGEELDAYRRWARGKRFLLLIDEPDREAEIQALIPPAPDALVLVAARMPPERLLAGDASLVRLAPFDLTASGELLRRSSPDGTVFGRDQVAALAGLTAGLPLALSIAGRLMGSTSASAAELIDRLAESSQAISAGATGGGDLLYLQAYRSLSPPAATIFRRLAVHPGPSFAPVVAGVAAGVDPKTALGPLSELSALRMIERQGRRLRFHEPLLRHARIAFEREEPSEEQVAAAERIVDFYAVAAIRLSSVLDPDHGLYPVEGSESRPGSQREALVWFDAERTNLRAAMEAATSRGWNNRAWVIGDALAPALRRSGQAREDTFAIFSLAAAAARRTHNPAAEARIHLHLAQAHEDRADLVRAEEERQLAVGLIGEIVEPPAIDFSVEPTIRQWSVVPEMLVETGAEAGLEFERYEASGGESALLRLSGGLAVRVERHEESFALVWPARAPLADLVALVVGDDLARESPSPVLLAGESGAIKEGQLGDLIADLHESWPAFARLDLEERVVTWGRSADSALGGEGGVHEVGLGLAEFDREAIARLLSLTGCKEVAVASESLVAAAEAIAGSYSGPQASKYAEEREEEGV